MIYDFERYLKDTGFRFIAGCQADCEKKLHEGFCASDSGFLANVSAEHIDAFLRDYIATRTEPLFLFIEMPCTLDEEELDAEGRVVQAHVNVYYWDGITVEEAYAVLDEYGSLLIGDGFCEFGFGVKSFRSEIMKERYNVISLYSEDPAADKPLMARHLRELHEFRTAWDYFDPQHPGSCCMYELGGQTVYDAVEALLNRGLYFGKKKAAD